MSPGLREGERVIRSGAANHRRGFEAVGGRLVLTNQRLLFAPHALNIQTGNAWFDLIGARDIRISGLFRNRLTIRFPHGEERFIVFRPTTWRRDIEAARAAREP